MVPYPVGVCQRFGLSHGPHPFNRTAEPGAGYQKAYGWGWGAKFAAQQPQFARGSHTPNVAVTSRQKTIGVGTSGSLTTPLTAAASTEPPVRPTPLLTLSLERGGVDSS
ncbi:hypothetical protein [Streptomyces yerevanensis]|uniref:hypothetical protein n=1 Tax=Streptomyces yerevanensis TaxID=66378 RepID=UPI0009962DDA